MCVGAMRHPPSIRGASSICDTTGVILFCQHIARRPYKPVSCLSIKRTVRDEKIAIETNRKTPLVLEELAVVMVALSLYDHTLPADNL